MVPQPLTMHRLFRAFVALTVAGVGFAGAALIGIAATAASSPGGRTPGEVVCHTLSPGERNAYVFAKCTNRNLSSILRHVSYDAFCATSSFGRVR